MRILLVGGNGFIGSPLTQELRASGHHLAIFHRRADSGPVPVDVLRIQGDRNRLSDYQNQLRRFSPDVINDLILSSNEQAGQLIKTSRETIYQLDRDFREPQTIALAIPMATLQFPR